MGWGRTARRGERFWVLGLPPELLTWQLEPGKDAPSNQTPEPGQGGQSGAHLPGALDAHDPSGLTSLLCAQDVTPDGCCTNNGQEEWGLMPFQ